MSSSANAPARTPAVEVVSSNAVIRLVSNMLDERDLEAIANAIDTLSGRSDVSVIILDVTRVKMIPSLGLGAFIQLAKRCREAGKKLKIAGAAPAVRQVFTITRLDKVLEMIASVEVGLE